MSGQTTILAAKAAHEVNRAYCLALGDDSQPAWDNAPDWQRESAIAGVQAVIDDPSTTPEQSHGRWLEHKRCDGWIYGPIKDVDAKTHPCMVEYSELPPAQRTKDILFLATVRGVLGSIQPRAESRDDATMSEHRRSAIEALEQLTRRMRTGEIDGAVIITTKGDVVAYSSWLNIRARALSAVSMALQGLNSNAVQQWWARSVPDEGGPHLHAVGPERAEAEVAREAANDGATP